MIEPAMTENKTVVLMGDLNCNLMPVNHLGEHLLLAMEGFMLTQLIKDPTRITQSSSSLIDVIFTTSPDKFESCGVLPFTGSDHLMIYGVLKRGFTILHSMYHSEVFDVILKTS